MKYAAGVVCIENARILLLRSNKWGGKLTIPGGKAEESDLTFHLTAERECHEETGITVRCKNWLPGNHQLVGDFRFIAYRAELLDESQAKDGAEGPYEWIKLTDLKYSDFAYEQWARDCFKEFNITIGE